MRQLAANCLNAIGRAAAAEPPMPAAAPRCEYEQHPAAVRIYPSCRPASTPAMRRATLCLAVLALLAAPVRPPGGTASLMGQRQAWLAACPKHVHAQLGTPFTTPPHARLRLLPLVPPALQAAADQAFLKLAGIKGDAQAEGHAEEIVLTSWSLGGVNELNFGQVNTGKSFLGTLNITHRVDVASPVFWQRMFTGTMINGSPGLMLTARTLLAGEFPWDFLKVACNVSWQRGTGRMRSPLAACQAWPPPAPLKARLPVDTSLA